ncbi:MAG: hypothetical protein NC548_52200 [Lachnospiraceae bacterium]|nr:hypothetical protein [Lachnospiraceae bacterium]
MATYTVFESVNMASTKYAERIFDCIAEEDIENGTFGYLNGLADGETNVYNFKKGTKSGETVIVADQPAWSENTSLTSNQRRDKFIIEAGTRFRVRVVKKNDEFGITAEGVTTATQNKFNVGAYVTIDASTGKLVASETAPAASAVMGAIVERKRTMGGTLATTAHNYGYSRVIYECRVTTLA